MSKNWNNSYKGMHVPNGHGSLFRAMDEDARIIAQCEANKLLWLKEANKQAALANNANNLNNPIVPPPPQVLNNQVPNNPPMPELERALAEIKTLKDAIAAKDLKIANMVSREEVEQIVSENRKNIQKMTEDLAEVRQENAEKDGVIVEQGKTIEMQGKEKENDSKKYEILESRFKMLEQVHVKDEITIDDLRNDKANLSKQNDKLDKELSSLKSLEKDFFEFKLSLKDAEIKKSKIKHSEKYMSNDDSEQNSWSHLEIKSSSSKSSVYKAKIKKLEEENSIFKSIFVEQNQKTELNKLLPENIENTFFQFEEINKIDIAGEIHHD